MVYDILNAHHGHHNHAFYVFLGERYCISWINGSSLHRLCHYTSFTLIKHQLNWREHVSCLLGSILPKTQKPLPQPPWST